MDKKLSISILALGIFLFAAFLRLYGINWDQNQHLHPDERFLTMVAGGISWPKDLEEYLDTQTSSLNPHNRGFGFFVYGTFPIFFTKWVAESLGQGDYGGLTLVGRQLSALFDLGTVLLVFLIGKQISTNQQKKKNWLIPLWGMFLYSVMVLPIQLSHFYAVDTYLTFFITLSFYFLTKLTNHTYQPKNTTLLYSIVVLLGVSFGLALASKITAVLFLPIIGIGLLINLTRYRNFKRLFVICSLLFAVCFLTFRFTQPYAFANGNVLDLTLNPKVLENWKQLQSFDDATGGFPPAIQWITTKPYLFPIKNMVLWGLGLPLGIISIAAILYTIKLLGYWSIGLFKRKQLTISNQQLTIFLSLFWIFIIFVYQGGQFVKALRYFFPIYPFMAIISGYFLVQIMNKLKINLLRSLMLLMLLMLLLIYPVSFISIYTRPHSRVEASMWIYKNIPAGATLSGEHWDDYLPMSLPTPGYIHEKYKSVEFPLYYPDNEDKWREMIGKLERVDYIIMSSNRLYGSISTVPAKYPVTTKYYKTLFDGSLGFEKVAEFTSRPNINIPLVSLCLTPPFARYGNIAQKSQECPLPGISFVDDYADETFTVYDHPKVIIFKKVKTVGYYNLLVNNKTLL